MCGIAGFIGRSSKPNVSFQIISQLFKATEIRGTDAAGFWGVARDGTVFYHKEPVRSSQLVQSQTWQSLGKQDLDLLLVHTRQASQGVGIPQHNKNNHPFTSTDRSVGLVHNGRIPEYTCLRRRYEVSSECDSEILLRIFEQGEGRLEGIKDIWGQVQIGHMAVAIGEKQENGRNLWLFRNQHRTLWLVDLRKALGQMFFCSTPELWREATAECKSARKSLCRRHKLVELPTEEVWHLSISEEQPNPGPAKRYQVQKEPEFSPIDFSSTLLIKRDRPTCQVVCTLGENDELPRPHLPVPANNANELLRELALLQNVIERVRAEVRAEPHAWRTEQLAHCVQSSRAGLETALAMWAP